ncbi:hypothetical protein ACPPVW_18560 [Leifsonia sp. McL0607]|uniref:hypothetical protein n=1 Tax=Leifsonia sp. McL0607 TaxID=3415672 RepID=UPI003CF63526
MSRHSAVEVLDARERLRRSPRRTRRAAGYQQPRRLPLTRRGFAGVGGGRWRLMPAPATFVAASVQVCGLWPFIVGSSRPDSGVPLGEDLETGSLVYADPISWFRAGFIANPSAMIFGLPGLGKSTLVTRWIFGLADRYIPSLVLGDIKGEYTAVIRELGGEVLEVAPGTFSINLLALGALHDAAERIRDVEQVHAGTDEFGNDLFKTGAQVAAELDALALQQATTLVLALCRLVRGRGLEDYEETLITVAIRLAHEQHDNPSLHTLDDILTAGDPALSRVAVTYSKKGYRKASQRLLRTVRSILLGPMGAYFAGTQSTPIPVGLPGGVSVDISKVARADDKVLAAVMIAVWAHGFAAIDALWELSRAQLAEWTTALVVQDELWKPMSLAPGLAAMIDQLARTNRSAGVGEVKITHSPKDPKALPTRTDRVLAMSFAEKSGMLIMFGLAKTDLRALDETSISLSRVEHRAVAGWRTPRSFRVKRRAGSRPKPPPGAGHALIKVGEAPGIPVRITVTGEELRLHDTNTRWARTSPQNLGGLR